MTVIVRVSSLSFQYSRHSAEEPLVALDGIDLSIDQGEFVTIIGPSGCGKSTLLHCIGGLLEPTEGEVKIAGSIVEGPDPKRAAFVFQEYTLLPWRSVLDNVALGLKYAGMERTPRIQRAMSYLTLMGLVDFAHAYPGQLSGGMQQRVGVARALAMEPELMLMDEPFGALDELTRARIGAEIARILSLEERTAIFVTHSLDEAVFLADRIVVMSARPGQVKEEIRVSTPRPRVREFFKSQEFANIRAHLFSLLVQPDDEVAAV